MSPEAARTPRGRRDLRAFAPLGLWLPALAAFAAVAHVPARALADAAGPALLPVVGALSFAAMAVLTRAVGRTHVALGVVATALAATAATAGLAALRGPAMGLPALAGLLLVLAVGLASGGTLVAGGRAGRSLRRRARSAAVGLLWLAAASGVVALTFAAIDASGPATAALVMALGLAVQAVGCAVVLPSILTLWPPWGSARSGGTTRLQRIITETVTVGSAGLAPGAPGTLGSLIAVPLAFLLRGASRPVLALLLTAAVLIACVAADAYCRVRCAKDPQEIVIDEVVGCLITLAFVPFTWAWVLAAFVTFRVLDTWKPGPIRWCERALPGGFGVVLDDVAAGLVGGVSLYALQWSVAL